MRTSSPQGILLIKKFEGFSSFPYMCAGGYLTIGYGHVVREDEHFSDGIDQEVAEKLLRYDVRIAEQAVRRLIYAPLTVGQFDALVSFTFNLGSGALQRSTLRRVVNREMHTDVPAQLRRWVWAGGQKLRGLVRRREAEVALYNS